MNLVEAAEFHHTALQRLNRSSQTIRLYTIYQQSFLAFLEEGQVEPTLDTLNPQFVREWQPWVRSRSTGRRGGLVAEKVGVSILKIWSRFLADNDVYQFDPLARLKIPRVPHIHRKPLSEDETRRLDAAASAGSNPIRDRALILIMLDTGCRVGELCAAQLVDLDVDEGIILFNRTKNGRPREVRFRVPGRRDGGPAVHALRQWLRVRDAQPGVDNIFTTREKWALSTRRVREIFKEWGEVARIPNVHPHRLRHTAASEYLAERPGAEISLRSRLGQIDRAVLDQYVTISDPTAIEAAGVASISAKWNLGSHSNGTQSAAHPATRSRTAAAQTRFCPGCGHQRDADDRFCASCGRPVAQ